MQDARFEPPRGPDGQLIEGPLPDARRLAVILVCVAAALGAMVIASQDRWLPALRDWIASDPAASDDRLTIVLCVLAALADLPLVFAGGYFWRLGERAIAEARFPPAGTSLVKPVAVLTGAEAVRRGRAAKAAALVFFGLGIALVTMLVSLVLVLRGGR